MPTCVALAALAGPIANAFGTPQAAGPLRGMAIVVLMQGLFLFVTGVFEALGRISINLRIVALESVVEGTAMVRWCSSGPARRGRPSVAVSATRRRGHRAGLRLARGRPAAHRRCRGERPQPRDIARYAGALLVIDGIFRIFSQVSVLLIGALLNGGRAVGLFQLPMILVWFLHYPAGAIVVRRGTPTRAPRPVSRPTSRVFARALRYIVAVQGIFIAPIVVWAEPILVHLLGAKYRDSAEVLRALAPFVLLAGPAMLVSVGVNYLGEARRRIPLAVLMLTANVVIDVALLPNIGIVAGAIANDAAYAIWVPGHLWILHRLIGLELRPQVLTLIRATAAAAVAAVPLLLLGTDVGIVVLILGCALSCLVYLAALRLIGELARDDIDFLRSLLARRFAWARR